MQLNFSQAIEAVQAMLNGFIERLPQLIIALLVFICFAFIGKGVRKMVRAIAQRTRRHLNVGLVLGRLCQGFIIFLGLLIALVIAIPGFTPSQLISILGLSSVAIGFAFRDILQNFLAGILLLLSEPFRIGDQIIVNNFEGTVEDIQTRATLIKTYDGRRVVIPNASLFTNSVTVNTAYEKRRLQYDIGIGYGEDIARAKRLLLNMVKSIPDVVDDPAPDILVVKLADSSVNLRLRWWVQPPHQFDVLNAQDAVLEKAIEVLLAEGFDLPYPTQQILFHDQTEEFDGDRARQRVGWPKGKNPAPRPARIVDALRDLKGERASGPNTASADIADS